MLTEGGAIGEAVGTWIGNWDGKGVGLSEGADDGGKDRAEVGTADGGYVKRPPVVVTPSSLYHANGVEMCVSFPDS